MCNTYNGYVNYQTWAVSLWLDNDYGSYTYYVERAEELIESNDGDIEQAHHDLASKIENDHDNPIETGVYSDLLTHALGNVDWHGVAESFIELAKEQIESETEDRVEQDDDRD